MTKKKKRNEAKRNAPKPPPAIGKWVGRVLGGLFALVLIVELMAFLNLGWLLTLLLVIVVLGLYLKVLWHVGGWWWKKKTRQYR